MFPTHGQGRLSATNAVLASPGAVEPDNAIIDTAATTTSARTAPAQRTRPMAAQTGTDYFVANFASQPAISGRFVYYQSISVATANGCGPSEGNHEQRIVLKIFRVIFWLCRSAARLVFFPLPLPCIGALIVRLESAPPADRLSKSDTVEMSSCRRLGETNPRIVTLVGLLVMVVITVILQRCARGLSAHCHGD